MRRTTPMPKKSGLSENGKNNGVFHTTGMRIAKPTLPGGSGRGRYER